MGQKDLAQLIRAVPFRPFRLVLSNNKVFEIHHPDLALVTPTTVHIGVPPVGSTNGLAEEAVIVSMRHVVEAQVLSGTAANDGNGQAPV